MKTEHTELDMTLASMITLLQEIREMQEYLSIHDAKALVSEETFRTEIGLENWLAGVKDTCLHHQDCLKDPHYRSV